MKKAASVFLRTEMTLRDVELLSQWMENPIITRYLNEMPGVSDSLRDLAGKIPAPLLALRFNQEGRFFLVCEKDGEAIDFVKLRPLQSRGTHEIVYAIGEESLWGRGYGKGAVRSALSAAFLDSCAERVIARIDPENTRSIRSVCACGFSRCGKEGKLHLYDLTQERYLENLRASYAQKRAEG